MSLRAKSRTIEKILHRAARSFFDMLCVERVAQRRCTCFRFQVSGFKFQVSVFKFQFSSFKFQVSSLKLIFEIVLELVVNVKSSEVEIL